MRVVEEVLLRCGLGAMNPLALVKTEEKAMGLRFDEEGISSVVVYNVIVAVGLDDEAG